VGYVRDDGRGFAEEEASTGGGTRSMKERAELVGGTFELSSSGGARCSGSIPLKRGSGNATYSDFQQTELPEPDEEFECS
jgi:glucose-6-phosphate-specific signal transduction histidine kinase